MEKEKQAIDDLSKFILEKVGIFLNGTGEDEILISRDIFLSDLIYEEIKDKLSSLKKVLSSTYLTSLHKEACKKQRWPLLNLVRQILAVYHYNMIPILKCDGYTLDGVKKFKRFFLVKKM